MLEAKDIVKRWWCLGGALAVFGLVSAGIAACLILRPPDAAGAPQQPIPFSHAFHVGSKNLSCLLCHTGVRDADRAGIPPLSTCMLCHQSIIITHPQIARLRQHYAAGDPVRWVRVNQLREFVYFSHQRHIRAGFDCSRCHGDVRGMDRIKLVHDFQMGFCVQCHRDNNYSHDCYICHR